MPAILAISINLGLLGCGTDFSGVSRSRVPSPSALGSPTASLTISSSPVVVGQEVSLRWTASAANQVAVEGEDFYSTQFSGELKITPTHSTTYFLEAANNSGIIVQTLRVGIEVPGSDQQAAHAQWWNNLDAVIVQLGCGKGVFIQQSGQGLQDAISETEQAGASCLVLQPDSTAPDAMYYEGLATAFNGHLITYISDIPDPPYLNPPT